MAPQGRMRGEFAAASRLWVIMANLPLISQRAGPLTASPEGGSLFTFKAFPRGGGKVAPQGRMRGEFAAAPRLWGIMANLPLISQRAGPLTASPEGGSPACRKTSLCEGGAPKGRRERTLP